MWVATTKPNAKNHGQNASFGSKTNKKKLAQSGSLTLNALRRPFSRKTIPANDNNAI
tara:strand:- start:136 stop:306 length:171 start_codon:yes stop_codon:yes gene_type:complete